MSTTYTVGVKIDGNAAGLARASKEAQAHVKQLGANATKEFSKMAKAREQLGVRPEREIQREIYKTEAAYARLARSGALSFNEQRRAARAMRAEVTQLTNEMGRLTGMQKVMRAGKFAAGGTVAAGVAAALIIPKVKTAVAYDIRLAHLANTGYSGSDKAGRAAGRRELDRDIQDAVKYGGGNRDEAINVATVLHGAGIFKPADVRAILRESVKAGTANDANPELFAEMAAKASKSMGIAPDQMKRIFGIATFAGQSGGFEVKDMARHLPEQMALAQSLGMSGEAGFSKLVAVNQGAVNTSGTKDGAGINVTNLLGKMGSIDTHKQLQKMGIDLPKRFAEGRMKGQDPFDVMVQLFEGQLSKDKNYQNVQKQLANSKPGSEREAALKDVEKIAQGTAFSKVFQDKQALLGLIGFMNDKARVGKIAADGPKNADASDRNYELISETASYKLNQTAMQQEMALQKTMDKFLPAIGGMADGVTSLMVQYPGYTTAVMAAAAAVTGLAGAAGLAALALGGGAPLPGGPGLPGAGGGKGAAGRVTGGLGKLGLAGMVLGLGYELFGTSDADLATLAAADAKKFSRGQGFTDPRIIGSGGAVSAAALEKSLRATEVKGEITVRVTAAPGINVETSLNSNSPRIPMKAALGQTNMNAGY